MARPLLKRHPADGQRAVGPVQGAGKVPILLQLAEEGQHIPPAPAGGAAPFPFLVIFRHTAIGQLAIDRRAATDNPPLLIAARGQRPGTRRMVAKGRHRDAKILPQIAGVEIGAARIAVENGGGLPARRGIRPGLQQQHAIGPAFRQAAGHNRAGRTAADDDVAVRHSLSHPSEFRPRIAGQIAELTDLGKASPAD